MKLALLGHQISHSLSPSIYKSLLGDDLESYELLDIDKPEEIPSLSKLANDLDGLSITAPYKKHFINHVEFDSKLVEKLGVINTISFANGRYLATNTDLLATEEILRRLKRNHDQLQLILLGSGSMAEMTILLAKELSIDCVSYSRKTTSNLSEIDLSKHYDPKKQTVVVNSCARAFIFKGILHPSFIFWDYNYSFEPHHSSLPSLVKSYMDGKEMLELQAQAALRFWKSKKA